MLNNRTLLIVITVLLLGILGYFAYENSRPSTIGGAINEAAEEVGDEIDDATTK